MTGALAAAPQWSGRRFAGNWDVVRYYAFAHLRVTLLALVIGAAVAFGLGLLGYRFRRSYPVILSVTNVLYTVPSLAFFVLLGAVFGFLSNTNIVVALAVYALAILVRNLVEGLRSVPDHVKDAALAVGYSPTRRLFAIELPLALPAVVAGLRVAAVSTISLVTVGGAIGRGGLGFLFFDGQRKANNHEIWAGLVATIVLAVVLDALLVLAGRLATPWSRAVRP